MNANQVIRMLLRLGRAQQRRSGNRAGQARTPEERAELQRRRAQTQGMRLGARLLRMFGRM